MDMMMRRRQCQLLMADVMKEEGVEQNKGGDLSATATVTTAGYGDNWKENT